MDEITLDMVRDSAEKIVGEKGSGFIYEPVIKDNERQCQYTFEGAPSCLVGRILFDLGVPIETLEGLDRTDTPAYAIPLNSNIKIEHGLALSYLNTLQGDQDSGLPWGRVLQYANDFLGQ